MTTDETDPRESRNLLSREGLPRVLVDGLKLEFDGEVLTFSEVTPSNLRTITDVEMWAMSGRHGRVEFSLSAVVVHLGILGIEQECKAIGDALASYQFYKLISAAGIELPSMR